MIRVPLICAALVALFGAISGCDKTCEKLRARVCDDPRYVKQNKRHCDMMQEAQRFENLSSAQCKSILDRINAR